MVSVDPAAIRFLREKSEATIDYEKDDVVEDVDEVSESTGEEPSTIDKSQVSDEPQASANPPSLKKSDSTELTPFNLPPYAAPFIFIPAYIEVNFATCSAIFVRRPTARYEYSEIPSPYEADGEIMRLSWEWYNKVRPRMRSKSQLARMPDNRKETRVIPGIKKKELHLPVGTSLKAQMARNSVY